MSYFYLDKSSVRSIVRVAIYRKTYYYGARMNLADFGRFSDPALLILSSLADGPKHGYGMMCDIETMTGVRLGAGTLYGALARLEGAELIKAIPSNDRRRPYQLTAKGIAALREQLALLQKLASTGLKRLAEQ